MTITWHSSRKRSKDRAGYTHRCPFGILGISFGRNVTELHYSGWTTCERGNRFLDRRFIVPILDQFRCLIP